MNTITSLPHHLCDTIETAPLDLFFQRGKGKRANILTIGESPALNGRILSGKAFYTQEGKLVPSGKRFNELMKPLGFTIEEIAFTELCKCVVGSERNLLKSCAPKCWSHLASQITHYNPKIIIILGAHTLDILNKIMKTNIAIGNLQNIDIENRNYHILGIYHPSPINPRSMALNQSIIKNNFTTLYSLIENL